ncbi:hypothetical protein PTNB85_07147 [Pyrenophora teres f. teres]|uniref:Uncharacterized protein n=1 Tax=Pyrenophora teres f. teres TaxID=97479 RepID=A0A6S6W5W6_9PLEO|nr:hypothetical protein PTNB85_07147 [Pyrenophora teres f. teres]KAE8857439.1 hypothetical protein PTNB29_08506 [Pyrenophora teres f. teres]CAE7185735.1 hypothetical protein PTTW11_06852 [Pyrenophora teres f. teres]
MASPPQERGRTVESTGRGSVRRGTPLRTKTEVAPVEKGESSRTGASTNSASPVKTEDSSNLTRPARTGVSSWLDTVYETDESADCSIPRYPTFTGKGKQPATVEEAAAQEYYGGGNGPVNAHGVTIFQDSANSNTSLENTDVPVETSGSSTCVPSVKSTLSAEDEAAANEPKRIDLLDLSWGDRVEGPEPEPGKEAEPEPVEEAEPGPKKKPEQEIEEESEPQPKREPE